MPNNDYLQDYLMHHGILGQKWGVRRYQNEDGSLTSAGKNKYYKNYNKDSAQTHKFKTKLAKTYQKEYSNTVRANRKIDRLNKRIQYIEKSTNKRNTLYKNDAAKYEKKAKISSDLDKKVYDIGNRTYKGKKVLDSLISGGYLNSYRTYRAMGSSKSTSFAKSLVAGPIGTWAARTSYVNIQYKKSK